MISKYFLHIRKIFFLIWLIYIMPVHNGNRLYAQPKLYYFNSSPYVPVSFVMDRSQIMVSPGLGFKNIWLSAGYAFTGRFSLTANIKYKHSINYDRKKCYSFQYMTALNYQFTWPGEREIEKTLIFTGGIRQGFTRSLNRLTDVPFVQYFIQPGIIFRNKYMDAAVNLRYNFHYMDSVSFSFLEPVFTLKAGTKKWKIYLQEVLSFPMNPYVASFIDENMNIWNIYLGLEIYFFKRPGSKRRKKI